jgi:hypothetical protein
VGLISELRNDTLEAAPPLAIVSTATINSAANRSSLPQLPARARSSPSPQTLRSISDNHVHLICGEDEAFADLPDHVRHLGPWQVMSRGEIEKLKPEFRLALARDGYALVTCELAVFKPEA